MTALDLPGLAPQPGPDIRFKSRQSIGFNITSGVTVKFDTEVYDTAGMFNPITGYFTAPQAGAYKFSIQIMGTSQASGQRIEIDLMDIASSGMLATCTGNYSSASAQDISARLITTVYLIAGQQVAVNVSANTGTITGYAWGGGDGTYICAELNAIGPVGPTGPSIPIFATPAARDAAIPSPTRGQACYLLSPAGMWFYNGPTVGWTKDWGVGWGRQTEAIVTSGLANITVAGSYDIATVTFTAVQNRLYVVDGSIGQHSLNVAGTASWYVTDNLNNVISVTTYGGGNAPIMQYNSPRVRCEARQFGPGSVTLKLRLNTTSTDFRWTLNAQSKILYSVDDVGPAADPP